MTTDRGRHGSDPVHARDDVRGGLEWAPDAVVIVDGSGAIVFVNAQTEQLFGYRRDELLGQKVEMLVPHHLRSSHPNHRAAFMANPQPRSMGMGRELLGRRKDASEFPVEIALGPFHTDEGLRVSCAIRDTSERRQADHEGAFYRAVVDSSHDAIISKDLDGLILTWNMGAERLFGYGADEVIGQPVTLLVPPGLDDETPALLQRIREGDQVDIVETIRERKDGSQVEVALTVSPIRDREGTVVGASTIARDISVRLRYQEQLRRLAEHDSLTGLRNRRRFERDIADQVSRARRYGEVATLLLLDLNGFKAVNDSYGHRMGDRLLKAIGAALQARLRQTDVVARVGGDEFAVLMPYAGIEQAAIIAGDLRDVVRQCHVETDDHQVMHVTTSLGFVQIDRETANDEAVMSDADRLMYEEKRAQGYERVHLPA